MRDIIGLLLKQKMERTTYFVDVLLPLPLPGLFTYRIPHEFNDYLSFGIRVVVPFGKNKLYSGIIIKVHTDAPTKLNVKYILEVIDQYPVISERQFQLWKWISEYYMCHLGEVMSAALPSALKIASETKIILHPSFTGDISHLTENELKLTEALSYRTLMTVDEISHAIGIAKVIPIIKSLVEKEIIITDEEIKNPYKPKIETYIHLEEPFASDEKLLYQLLDTLSQSKKTQKQADLLLKFLMMQQKERSVPINQFSIKRTDFLKETAVSIARLETLISKGIFKYEEKVVSRLEDYNALQEVKDIQLSEEQQDTIYKIQEKFSKKSVVLLHGVTGSGKTEIYIKLINQVLESGKQVLYLLPEIALTSQIVNRLRKYFGTKVGVYHSRFNEYERVEIWNRVLGAGKMNMAEHKYQLILGARSALLLPYQNLGLIIVDEEHDGSYKQQDPAPRYHARDAAIMLGMIHETHTLLGTATPSIETYYNTQLDKYGLVELNRRYAVSQMPEIWTVDLRQAAKLKQLQGNFSDFLLQHIRDALKNKEQVILFQNRRGYSLRLFCNSCETMPTCIHCDVTLTYHKKSNLLKCHYCGYAIDVPEECPTCKSRNIEMKGFGTEKLEEEIQSFFPEATIVRMDLDTTRSKTAYQTIISDFENKKIDILVGTQMVTKGLDFDNVSVVGVLNADHLISFPDFRAFEKAFQTIAQVSGRAGRKNTAGKVIIQSYQPKHPALQYVISNDYVSMYRNQIKERESFHYPPIYRLIKLTLKHKEEQAVNKGAEALAPILRNAFPEQVLGPEFPLISRIQNYYLKDFWIKFPKSENLAAKKHYLQHIINQFLGQTSYKTIRIIINVDC